MTAAATARIAWNVPLVNTAPITAVAINRSQMGAPGAPGYVKYSHFFPSPAAAPGRRVQSVFAITHRPTGGNHVRFNWHLLPVASLLLCLGGGVQAAQLNFSFAGEFDSATDTHSEFFRTGDGGNTIYILTYGYAGGTQVNGNNVAAGGFDPELNVFDSANNSVGSNDDGEASCFDNATAFVGGAILAGQDDGGAILDSCLQLTLNAPTELFRIDLSVVDGDFFGFDGRSTAWAFDILGVEFVANADPVVPVPTPGGLALLAAVGMGFGLRRRLRARSDQPA